MKIFFALLNLSLLLYFPLFAQDENLSAADYSNISAKAIELIDEYFANGFEQDTGAVILLREAAMKVDENNFETVVFHIIGKIFDERAKDDYSQIPISFNSYYEDMKLDFARTISEDKTFLNVSEDAVQIKTPPEYFGYKTYTDSKILAFSLPALDVNKYFEYQITVTVKKPVIENRWFHIFTFNQRLRNLGNPYFIRIDPVKTSRFILKVKEGEKFRYEVVNFEGETTKIVNDGVESYTWEINDVAPIIWEPGMPFLYEIIPSITVSSIVDWNEFTAWAYSTLGERIKVTDDIKSIADELTFSSKSKTESIKIFYDYVRNEIDYIQADLDRGGLIPHNADEVLRTKYGDCKDQVILLLSLLKAIDIDGFPALLSTYSHRDHQNHLPTQYFDHLIVYIPTDSSDIWLDATTEFMEFPHLYYSNQNRWVLVITEQEGKFIKTPSSSADYNQGLFNISIHPENDSLISTMVLKSRGAIKDNLYAVLSGYSNSEQKTVVSEIIDYYYNGGTNLQDFKIVNSDDNFYTQTIKANCVDPLNELTGFTFTNNMAFVVLYYMINLPALESRKFDCKFPFKFSLQGREVYHSPWENVTIWNVPESDSVISEYFEFHQYFNEYEDSVEVEWDFILSEDLVKAEDFESFTKEFEEWDEMVAYEINFIKLLDHSEQSVSDGNRVKIDKTINPLLDSNTIYVPPTIVHTKFIDPEITNSIIMLLEENVDAANEKDFDRVMNTIHIDNPSYNSTIKAMEKMLSNEIISISFSIENLIVVDVIKNCAIATNTHLMNTKYMSNEAAFNFEVVNVLMNADDGWKIYNTYAMSEKTTCDLYEELGRFFYNKKEYETTIIFYELAAANDSTCDRVYGNLGWTYYLTGDHNKCIEYSEKAVQRDSTALYAHYNIALSYLCLGEIEKSKTLYTDIVEYNKDLKRNILDGAIIDLKDLIDKDFMKIEAEFILNEIFHFEDISDPIEAKKLGNKKHPPAIMAE